jgi:hypothetical protein
MSTQRPKGTLKIVFTTEDLALTRIANRADLMWEMMGSLHRLQIRDGGATMDSWRRQAHLRLTETGLLPSVRALLLPLAPRGPYFPDFLTPHRSPAIRRERDPGASGHPACPYPARTRPPAPQHGLGLRRPGGPRTR